MSSKRPIITSGTLSELPDTDTLIAGEGTMVAEQSVSLGTPASGYGVVYAKTDGKLYFKNDAGTEFDLTATGGGGTNPVIREYIANDTWTKPTAANFWGALVLCVGAGGGGGSGRRGASLTTRGAGSGGSGAAMSYRIMRRADLSSATYSIVIGSGGIGATAVLFANDQNGASGNPGGDTSFGAFVIARGGNSGPGGTTTAVTSNAAGGSAVNCTPSLGPFSLSGGASGPGNSGSQGVTGNTGLNGVAGAGGGGGGGISIDNVTRNGGGGGGIVDVGATTPGGSGGITSGPQNGGNGTNVANNLIFDTNNTTTNAMGGGGGGGAAGNAAGTVAGGTGGVGGRGAGGGGGGASTNGAASGAGGNGGPGLCIVVEYYGA